MAMTESESLLYLERILDEFFSPDTSNERKRDIDNQLKYFNMTDSWRLCIFCLKNSQNQHVLIYASNTIQTVINLQWSHLQCSEQLLLKVSLTSLTFEMTIRTPSFVRNKVVKLLVEVVKQTAPNCYDDHFKLIVDLLQSEEKRLIGLVVLKTTSEELSNSANVTFITLPNKLCEHTSNYIPDVLMVLMRILEDLSTKSWSGVTTTPPPSPTGPSQQQDLAMHLGNATFRPGQHEVLREALATIQHLFTWVNLNFVTVNIVIVVFQFTNFSTFGQNDDGICVAALSAINELLYRKTIPSTFYNVYQQMYLLAVHFLRDVAIASTSFLIDSALIDKMSELMTLFIGQHLWRFEKDPLYSAMEFLTHLYQLTVNLTTIPEYMRCLTVWKAFIKHIKEENIRNYHEPLLGLIVTVLTKIQFSQNKAQLLSIGSEASNSELWDNFQIISTEIISLVAKFSPYEVFSRCFTVWRPLADQYMLLRNVDISSGELPSDVAEIERLSCALKDLSTLTDILASLIDFFSDPDAEHCKPASFLLDSLLSKLIEIANLSVTFRFYNLRMSSELNHDFIDVHCKTLYALRTMFSRLGVDRSTKVRNLCELLNVAIPIIRTTQTIPPPVTLAAAHVFLSITTTIRPTDFIETAEVVELVYIVTSLRFPRNESREVILCAMASFLLKPWGKLSNEEENARNMLTSMFFNGIVADYVQLNDAASDQYRTTVTTTDCLPCLTNIIDYCSTLPMTSKKMLYAALKPAIEHTLNTFQAFTVISEVSEMQLNLLYKVMEVFQPQLGQQGIQHAVEMFLAVAIKQHEENRFDGLDMLLRILQLIVEAPGTVYKSFLPSTLDFCIKQIFPNLMPRINEHPDVVIALLRLLHSILLNQWNFFFVSQIRLGNSPGCSNGRPAQEIVYQEEHLLKILQIFGVCLEQSDINVFRTSLGALESVHAKWKLYNRNLFTEHMLVRVLNVLTRVLLDKTHDLYRDDIFTAFFNLAKVNVAYFYDAYLCEVVQNLDGLTAYQKEVIKSNFSRETDMPTFVQNLQRCINDVQCYLMHNRNLPPNTII